MSYEFEEFDKYGMPDGETGGSYDIKDDGLHVWDGMIGEIANKRADIGVGAVQVMTEREYVIDFTTAWYERVGFTLAMKKFKEPTYIFQYLTVMNMTVWGTLFTCFFVTAFLIWLYERFSPDSYMNNREFYADDNEQRLFTVRECCWFVFCALTPQGAGLAPKNMSGKIVAASWWLFGFISIASYTANLAAYLTVNRLKKPIIGFEDLMASTKNIDYNIIGGTEMERYVRKMSYIEERFYE